MIIGDILDLLTKRRHCLMGNDNVDKYFFSIVLVGNSIKWPDDLIGKKKTAKSKVGNRGKHCGQTGETLKETVKTPGRSIWKHQRKW